MLLTAYLLALSFGAVLLGASLLLGDADHDADVDADHDIDMDADHDVDVDHAAAADSTAHLAGDAAQGILFNPLLSIRFWTYFSASFGGLGTCLHFANVPSSIHAPLSIGVGAVTGYAVALLFRSLRNSTVSSETSAASLVGSEANVLLSVPTGGTGKVRVRMAGQDVDLHARSGSDAPIERGATVLIVSVKDGVARVEALAPGADVETQAQLLSEAAEPATTSPAAIAQPKKTEF